MDAAALILAAGRGARAGVGVPKQYRIIAGQPMLRRALRPFLDHPRVGAVRVVIHPDDAGPYQAATADLELSAPVMGGATRQDSCRLGLESLADSPPVRVLIHDAARPFVDTATIDRVLDALGDTQGAIPALAVSDALKRASDDGMVREGVNRAGLWRAQTPQGFAFAAILDAHRRLAGAAHADDAAVAEAAGLAVALVPGSEDNVKITTDADFVRAERMLAADDIRVGGGFDVHRFAPGDHIMLCGVRIAHGHGLAGHSDADVGLHALTDALLGAIGAGDIGQHFPPAEARWRDAESALFLRHAARLVAEYGGRIRHLDVTLICERPKLAPHRDAMRARIADILDLDPARVSVKATTTEGLGFTGRGEGIAAQATATVAVREWP